MLLKSYQNRKLPELELINSKQNSLFKNGKIYEVNSTCEELDTRLKWYRSNNRSQVYNHKNNNPKTKLIVNAPCKGRKGIRNFIP